MSKLIVLVGPSGSGKTTYAKNATKGVRISSDDLREEYYGNPEWQFSNKFLLENGYTHEQLRQMTVREKTKACNNLLFRLMEERASSLLKEGQDVYYDATSLSASARASIIQRFKDECDEISAIYFIVDKEECKRRNRQRSRVVPDEVIDRQFDVYSYPTTAEGFKTAVGIPN